MPRLVTLAWLLLIPSLVVAQGAKSVQEPTLEESALLQLNAFRRAAGLEVVTLDPTLSGGCAAHAAYLVKNNGHASTEGLGAHDEDAQLPGFTEDGKKAAKSSNISFGHPPVAAVDCWMNSLFHRIPILDPNLKKVGFGYARGTGRWRWITVLDVERGREKGRTEQIIAFPGDAQKNVPVFLQRGETPDPIPDDKDKQAGYPITITFPLGAMVRQATAVLKLPDGKEVEVWLSTPEKPVDARFQRNTICMIAKDPLRHGTVYSVTASAMVSGKMWSQSWSFTTASR